MQKLTRIRRLKKNNNKYNTYKEIKWGFLDV
jgi:hypothetical protein